MTDMNEDELKEAKKHFEEKWHNFLTRHFSKKLIAEIAKLKMANSALNKLSEDTQEALKKQEIESAGLAKKLDAIRAMAENPESTGWFSGDEITEKL